MTSISLDREESPECPLCGDRMLKRTGKYGKFWGCINFPKCRGHQKESSDPDESGAEFEHFMSTQEDYF